VKKGDDAFNHHAGAHGRRDLHSGASDAARRGGNEHGFPGLEAPSVDQAGSDILRGRRRYSGDSSI
jgi:hypothetical protein